MIHVHRINILKILQRNATRWLNELQNAIRNFEQVKNNLLSTKQQINQAKHVAKLAQEKYNHAEVKTSLVPMFHGKCAYCESQITIVDYGLIEHFYPKSVYIGQTFNWDNFLLSCAVCNDINHKGTNFLLAADGTPFICQMTVTFYV